MADNSVIHTGRHYVFVPMFASIDGPPRFGPRMYIEQQNRRS